MISWWWSHIIIIIIIIIIVLISSLRPHPSKIPLNLQESFTHILRPADASASQYFHKPVSNINSSWPPSSITPSYSCNSTRLLNSPTQSSLLLKPLILPTTFWFTVLFRTILTSERYSSFQPPLSRLSISLLFAMTNLRHCLVFVHILPH